MTETVDRTPYIDAFLTERPKDGIDLLQTRLRSALKLNDELADYFKERAAIEDLYAKNLTKLNKKLFVTEKSALGGMLPSWNRIQSELLDTSIIHATLASKMQDEVEKSLRSIIVTDQSYAELRSLDPTFQKLAKDYDDRHGKMIKQKKILEKPGKRPSDAETKYADLNKQWEATRSDWQQKSPKYIQLFQTVDEQRLHSIKNHLLQFETIQTDQMLKRVQLAGDNLASVSELSVECEIISFCAQYTADSAMNSTSLPQSTLTAPSTIISSSPSSPMPTNTTPVSMTAPGLVEKTSPPPSLLIDTSDDIVQPQSTKSTESYTSSHTVGTHAPSLPSVVEDMQGSQQHGKAPSIKSNKKADKQRKFLSTFSMRLKPKLSSSNQFGGQPLSDSPDAFTQQPSGKASSFMDNASIYSISEEAPAEPARQQSALSSNTLHAPTPTLRKTSSFADSFFNQPSSPQNQNSTPSILVDDEGFSIPPSDRSPWTMTTSPTTTSAISSDEQQDSNDLASMDSGSLYSTSRLKLDIKAESVVVEDAKSSQVALTRVASMLKETNPSATKRPRGRRELRSQLLHGNTLTLPTSLQEDSTLTATDTLSPFAHDDDEEHPVITCDPPANRLGLEDEPTLSVRITEVIHAQLRQGEAQRLMVTGEVALLYQGPKDQPIHFLVKHNGTETTLLAEGIQRWQDTDDGVIYQLTPDKIDTTYTTCIKYRQAQEPSSHLVVPLLVKPMWKCDGDQARLMIKYSQANEVTMDQVMMLTHVDGNCHSAQSLPPGQWVMDQQKMVWSSLDAGEQVIRAKFFTASLATPQPIAVRFEMRDQLFSSLQVVEQPPLTALSSGTWARIDSVVKSTRSGKYIAEA